MPTGVSNPSRSGGGALKFLSGVRYAVAGTYTVTPPPGTRQVRLNMRGAGGAGGGNDENYQAGGTTGGQGALQRRLVARGSGPFTIVVGVKGSGSSGSSGGNSSALGFTALGGTRGQTYIGQSDAGGQGGVGVDGVEPAVGHGNFTGGTNSESIIYVSGQPRLGSGGPGAAGRANYTPGSDGSDGFCELEFLG